MALMRTKMFIACAMVAGVLTTGIGARIMSSADAQNPKADPSPEQIKNTIEFLQKARHQQQAQPPSDRFEYKFVPIEKPLSAEELRRLVSAFDREGWEYTGAQDLATGNKTGSTIPHVVFKKLRQADNRTAEAVTEGLLRLGIAQEGAWVTLAANRDAEKRAFEDRAANAKRTRGW